MNLDYNLQDYARLDIARKLWNGRAREAVMAIWMDDNHPGKERFLAQKERIVGLLECSDPETYARSVEGQSLRTLIREIPVIFPDQFRQQRERLGIR